MQDASHTWTQLLADPALYASRSSVDRASAWVGEPPPPTPSPSFNRSIYRLVILCSRTAQKRLQSRLSGTPISSLSHARVIFHISICIYLVIFGHLRS